MTRPLPSGTPPRKIDELRAIMAAGDWPRALAFAAKFPRLGEFKRAIERGHQAAARPEFTRAVGRDPDADIAAGIAALRERYGE
jgi:hypothetical protein